MQKALYNQVFAYLAPSFKRLYSTLVDGEVLG